MSWGSGVLGGYGNVQVKVITEDLQMLVLIQGSSGREVHVTSLEFILQLIEDKVCFRLPKDTLLV